MTTNTILLLVLSLIVAVGLSYFQYYYKAKSKLKINLLLAFLRFLGIFGLLLLLINPLITSNATVVEKPILAIVVDNSSSIANLKADQTATELHSKLTSNKDIRASCNSFLLSILVITVSLQKTNLKWCSAAECEKEV